MRLISCEYCGTVLDAEKIEAAEELFIENKVSQMPRSGCVGYEPGIECPVCKRDILLEDGALS